MADYDIGGGFLRGVAARRQIEETREIIADRARRTEAEQKMQALRQQLGEMGADGVLSLAKLRDVKMRMESGEDVSPDEMKRAIAEQGMAITDFQAKATPLVMQIIQSAPGNDYLFERASKINGMLQENATRTAAMLESMHAMHAEDQRIALEQMTAKAQIAESQGRLRLAQNQDARDAGREPFVREELAARTEAQRAQTEHWRGSEERADQLHPFEVGKSAAGVTGAVAQADRAVTDAQRAKREEMLDRTYDQMAFLERASAGVEALRRSGQFSDEQIAAKVKEIGLDPGQLTSLRDAFDEEAAGELARLDKRIAKTKDMVAKGAASQDDLAYLTRQKDRIEITETKRQSERLAWDEMVANEGEVGAAWEKLKLVAQRRGLESFGKIVGGNPAAALPRLLRFIRDEDISGLLEESGPMSTFFGRSYAPPIPTEPPSERPSLGEQVERGVYRDPKFDEDAWKRDQSP